MAQYVSGLDRSQPMLLPASVDDYVSPENPVRVLEAFIDALDLDDLGFKTRCSKALGRSAFDPATLIKIYLWGYLNRTKSSRRLEHACASDLSLIWLTGNLRPDHSTISDFRKTHPAAIKKLFREFNLLCRKLDLFGRELLAIDGSFFKAVNSKNRSFTKGNLAKMLARIDANIEKYITQLNELDSEETPPPSPPETESPAQILRQKIANINKHREELQTHLDDCQSNATGQKNLTDSDSVFLIKNGQSTVGYNVQSAVDAKHHLIVTIEATQDRADHQQLLPMSRQAKADLGLPPDAALEIQADTGYHSGPALTTCEQENTLTFIPARKAKSKVAGDGSIKDSDFIYDQENDRYQCPQGKYLARKKDSKGAKVSHSNYRVYFTVSSCKNCPLLGKCTKAKYRKYKVSHDHLAIEAAAERLRQNPEKMKQRGSIVEHPFGTMKDRLGRDHFVCRGLALVGAELSLSALAYNLTRAIQILGASTLLREIKNWNRSEEAVPASPPKIAA